jgi:quercetin dioxygenase-like cupin family protein
MTSNVRRVVTGHDSDGHAVFVSDSLVEPVTSPLSPSSAFHLLWGGDEAPHYPNDGTRPEPTTFFPPLGGYRFLFFAVPPDGEQPSTAVDVPAALADLDAALPGLFQYNETDAPGMHTTATVDFEVVLSGEVTLELDDGASVHLHPGDTVVQNGTRHRWGNPTNYPATVAVFMSGARHDNVT